MFCHDNFSLLLMVSQVNLTMMIENLGLRVRFESANNE